MRRPPAPPPPAEVGLSEDEEARLRAHVEELLRGRRRHHVDLFVFRLAEGVFWARHQIQRLHRDDEARRRQEMDRSRRATLAERAREFRDRLALRLEEDCPISGTCGVDLVAFSRALDLVVRGLEAEAPKEPGAPPEAVWRDELIALVDDTYDKLFEKPERGEIGSRRLTTHRTGTIVLLFEFLGLPRPSRTLLRDSRRRGVEPGVGRLAAVPDLRIVGDTSGS